jgi:site-specific DNA recombinase
MKAAIYVRVSTEEQANKGASIEAQRDYLMDWARKEELKIVETYIDDGYSGKSIEGRPALTRMLEDAKNGSFKVILCYHNDRLSRNTKDALTIVEKLQKYGVFLRFSNLDIDITTPEGELMFTMQAGFATYFRKDLARKTSFGMQKLKRSGFWMGRIPDLFETQKKNGHIKISPKPIVYEILELRKLGKSYRKIASQLKISHSKVWRTVKIMENISPSN